MMGILNDNLTKLIMLICCKGDGRIEMHVVEVMFTEEHLPRLPNGISWRMPAPPHTHSRVGTRASVESPAAFCGKVYVTVFLYC